MARGSLRPCPGGDACRGYVSGDGVTSPLGLDAVLPCGGPLGVSACTHVTRHRDRNAWARSEVARSWLEVLGAFPRGHDVWLEDESIPSAARHDSQH